MVPRWFEPEALVPVTRYGVWRLTEASPNRWSGTFVASRVPETLPSPLQPVQASGHSRPHVPGGLCPGELTLEPKTQHSPPLATLSSRLNAEALLVPGLRSRSPSGELFSDR